MTDGEKIALLEQDFEKIEVDEQWYDDKYNAVLKGYYSNEEDLYVEIYDYAESMGIERPQAFIDYVESRYDDLVRGEESALEHSGLGRTKKWEIRKLPHGEWFAAIDKAKPREKPLDIPIRLYNGNAFPKGLSYRDKCVFSALCCAHEKGRDVIDMRGLWAVLHQRKWYDNEPDKAGFAGQVEDSVGRLDAALRQFEDEPVDWLLHFGNGRVTLNKLPSLWQGKNKTLIRRDMIGCRAKLPWFAKLYIAERVLQSRRFANAANRIRLDTLAANAGEHSVRMLTSYMEHLERLGYVSRPRSGKYVFDRCVEWSLNKENEDGRTE